jgi:hypothetical protein
MNIIECIVFNAVLAVLKVFFPELLVPLALALATLRLCLVGFSFPYFSFTILCPFLQLSSCCLFSATCEFRVLTRS